MVTTPAKAKTPYKSFHKFTGIPTACVKSKPAHAGYWFVRFDYLVRGRNGAPVQATVAFPASARERVAELFKKGEPFSTDGTPIEGNHYTTRIQYDRDLGVDVLLFSDEQQASNTKMEDDSTFISTNWQESGFEGYPDNYGSDGVNSTDSFRQLDPDFKYMIEQLCDGMLYAAKRLGCKPAFTVDHIQRSVVSCAINSGKDFIANGQIRRQEQFSQEADT